MASWGNQNRNNYTPPEVQDVKVAGEQGANASCGDGISSLSFAPDNKLLASSWDGHLRCWQVQKNGNQIQAMFGAKVSTEAPSLCSCFNGDGTIAFSGGSDNTVRMWQLNGAPTANVIGKHDQPVKSIHYVEQNNMVVTGSWDSTIRFWDMRQPTETFKLQLPQKVLSMDVNYPYMVCSTAEATPAGCPRIHLYSMAQGAPQLFNNAPIDSTLKHQTRCVTLFNNQSQGFVIGSIEGRVEIKDINDLAGKRSFAFKCHRQKNPQHQHGKEYHHVYAVNAIAFNSRGTFATAGSDGTYNFWDKEAKTRLKEFKSGVGCRSGQQARQPGASGQTISACAWSPSSEMFAYASSYDWSRGDDQSLKSLPNDIYLHAVTENDLKPPKSTGRK